VRLFTPQGATMPLERKPVVLAPRGMVGEGLTPHRVKDGESWKTLADRYGIPAETIILANFQTLKPEEVNWYLHHYVGCRKPTADGKNWMFSSSATPGIVQIPPKTYVFEGDTITVRHPYADIDVGPFRENNTDLGKFSHGNFDVRYDPKAAALITTLRVEYKFESGITPTEQSLVKQRLAAAVRQWSNAPFYLKTENPARNQVIHLRFELTTGPNPHKTVDVEKDSRREWVGMDLNIHKDTSIETLVHELGHVFGNYDEYKGSGVSGWLERRMWWHDNNYMSDTAALMNSGKEFRARYFDHFADFVNKRFRVLGVTYRAVRVDP
jgi:hypothetical protein